MTNLAWLSDTKLQFCGQSPKTPLAKLQATFSKTKDEWTVTSVGACTD